MLTRKLTIAAVLVAAAVQFSGCTLARIYATSGNGIHLTQIKNIAGQPFKVEQRMVFDFTSAMDVEELLRERYGSGHEFQNVTVKVRSDPVDVLLNLVTLGIAQSKTFEVSGDKIS